MPRRALFTRTPDEPLAVLLLPSELEQFDRDAHARDLLQIPRVIALEPPRRRTPRLLRDSVALRQAKRLRLPGQPRVIVLYHPAQYPLARALCATHDAELWYARPDLSTLRGDRTYTEEDLLELDRLAVERGTCDGPDDGLAGEPLRIRLRELEIISPRAFVPGARINYR
jgi:hypothetical protein